MADSPKFSGYNKAQMGFDPEMVPAGPEPTPPNLFTLANEGLQSLGDIAYQVVPDPLIAAGRSALRGTPYAGEKASLEGYKQEQSDLARPSEVQDPAHVSQPLSLYDNPQQEQHGREAQLNMIGATGAGMGPPRGSNFSEVGKGFMHNGKIYDTGPFHDLNKLPEHLQNAPEGYLDTPHGVESGWILRGENTAPAQPGTSPEFPRFVRREDFGKSGPGMLGRPEYPAGPANESMDPFITWRPSEGPPPVPVDYSTPGPPVMPTELYQINPMDLKRAADEVAANKAATDAWLAKFGPGKGGETPPVGTYEGESGYVKGLDDLIGSLTKDPRWEKDPNRGFMPRPSPPSGMERETGMGLYRLGYRPKPSNEPMK